MATKQQGSYAADSSKYACIVDGAGNLVETSTVSSGTPKQNLHGSQAPDGSIYMVLTDGAGNTV